MLRWVALKHSSKPVCRGKRKSAKEYERINQQNNTKMSFTTLVNEDNVTLVQAVGGIRLCEEAWMKKKLSDELTEQIGRTDNYMEL